LKCTELYNKANISNRSRKNRERERERRQTNLNEHSRFISERSMVSTLQSNLHFSNTQVYFKKRSFTGTDIERAEQYSINGKEEKEKPQTQEPNYEKKQCSLRAWAKDLSWDWVAPPIQASHLVEEHHLPSSEVPLHAWSI